MVPCQPANPPSSQGSPTASPAAAASPSWLACHRLASRGGWFGLWRERLLRCFRASTGGVICVSPSAQTRSQSNLGTKSSHTSNTPHPPTHPPANYLSHGTFIAGGEEAVLLCVQSAKGNSIEEVHSHAYPPHHPQTHRHASDTERQAAREQAMSQQQQPKKYEQQLPTLSFLAACPSHSSTLPNPPHTHTQTHRHATHTEVQAARNVVAAAAQEEGAAASDVILFAGPEEARGRGARGRRGRGRSSRSSRTSSSKEEEEGETGGG